MLVAAANAYGADLGALMLDMNSHRAFSSWDQAVRWLRAQESQARLVIDCYYDDPLIDAADRYWHSDEWQAVRVVLRGRKGAALDVGAGRGIASYALARDGFAVTALEPDPSNLVGAGAIRTLAADSCLPIRVVEEFSERLPFEDGTFDVVFARAVLHHTRDLGEACREFHRVLKPGGMLVAIREHVITKPGDLEAFLHQHPLHRLYGGEHAFMLREYMRALEQAGFDVVSVLSPWHSAINFAPYNLAALKEELVRRTVGCIPFVRGLVRELLSLPGIWWLVRAALARFDNRPGRLFSFVANKN